MATLSAADARQLAADFHELAVAIGHYRFDNWGQLSPALRSKLESSEWTLLRQSSDFSLQAMAITLSDIDATLKNIKGATDEARKAIGRIRTVDRVIRIASAATVLGAAIANGNPNGITDAVRALYDEASSAKQAD